MAWVSLCELSELTEGQGKYVEIDGFELAVFLHEGQARAIDNACPHAGASLAAGYVDNGCVICPMHYWAFSVTTGEMPNAPGVRISTYPTRLFEREGQSPLVQADLPMP